MKVVNKKNRSAALALGLVSTLSAFAANDECPPPVSCAPCGEYITNMPLPTYEARGVQPLQNYIATYESCPIRGVTGFYFGTGFGYGTIDYDLKIPGLIIKDFSNSYITEYVTIGFTHSTSRFFIGGELGWYFNSVTKPIFYEDPSSFIFTITAGGPGTITEIPCGVRININAQNHVAFDLLPGFIATPSLILFSRLGIEYTNYSWVRRTCLPQTLVLTNGGEIRLVSANEFFNSIGNFSDIGDKETDGVVDFRLGLGASYAAGRHISFNINYIHIFGSRASFTPEAKLITPGSIIVLDGVTKLPVPGILTSNANTLLAQNTIDPSRNEILFGMTVTF